MKRIIFCFDGTSNEIDEDAPTNVLLLASGIANKDRSTEQVIYYKKGVGTTKGREAKEGATGKGLYEKVKEAYEFLCFNYAVGDEIFVFGFSRGAYTARSFCGFVYLNGITRRAKIEAVLKADKAYRERGYDALRDYDFRVSRYSDRLDTAVPVCCSTEEQYYRLEKHKTSVAEAKLDDFPLINIKYLGVWDTVKTLTYGKGEDDHTFHIDDLSEIIGSARHAVSIDEYRKEFDVTVFGNIDDMNETAFHEDDAGCASLPEYHSSPKRKYQEMWFPGDHGSVGGGGNIRGLSDFTFLWVLEGAIKAGLKVDTDDISKIFKIQPDPRASLDYTSKDTLLERAWNIKAAVQGHQRCGPRGMQEVGRSVILRAAYSRYDDKTEDIYDPGVLRSVWPEVQQAADAYTQEDFDLCLDYNDINHNAGDIRTVAGKDYYVYRIVKGEMLGTIAKNWLGRVMLYKDIIKANKIMIPSNGAIQSGQFINLPINDFLKAKLDG